ncbi:hypothetical protein PARHAE_01121 [Paracoccus haematequi]|uniref:Uncharacterized protein n=1 Tax=Paracoccus haematequi TaxID=2491866 RepID=A0A3S4CXH5_9RHOB|nr:hypothetical protein [Paracoccus haematequi]VDS07941.1 hypothetical protein PARHAE_01121 [Paracoccus haematequi]
MTAYLYPGDLADHQITATLRGKSLTIEKYGDVPDVVELSAFGGRVNEFPDLASVSPDYAPLLVQQADGSATLDLKTVHQPVVIPGTLQDGRVCSVSVSRMSSKNGWGRAEYYMLETDDNGDLVLEPGDYHREIWVSGDPSAWTRASIAAAQTPPIAEASVTGAWLLQRPFYGSTEAQKVSGAVAQLIIEAMHAAVASDRIHPSWWLYVERGYDYTGLDIKINLHGESPLHPRVIRAFGTGSVPKGIKYGNSGAYWPANLVSIGVDLDITLMRTFENWLTADTDFIGRHREFSGDKSRGLTLYRTKTFDGARQVPVNGSTWTAHPDRSSGIYFSDVLGSLFLDTFWDKNGWVQDQVVDGTWNNGQYGQPPSIYSHNVYTSEGQVDMSWHGMLTMRGASLGGQMRIGGWQIDCTAIDNMLGLQNSGLRWSDVEGNLATQTGFFPINIRTVATSGRDGNYITSAGAKKTGLDFLGVQSVDVDCLVLHVSNPDDAAEVAAKNNHQFSPNNSYYAYKHGRGSLWSNLVVRRWNGDLNLAGLVTSFIDTITIQRWAGQKLGKASATIAEYATYCRGLSPRQLQLEIKAVNRYLLSAREPNLELPMEDRTTPQVLTFKPDFRGEGFRSDNPLNWSSKDTPINGDSLEIGDNIVKWVKDSRSLEALSMGEQGIFQASSGKVSFEAVDAGSHIEVGEYGKFYADSFDGFATVRGGRFAVNGPSAGDFEASGQGQLILGPDCRIRDGETLRIVGDMGKVGWDAISPSSVLTVEAGGTLEFHATALMRFDAFNLTAWDKALYDFLGQTSGASGKFDSWRRIERNGFVRIRDLIGTPIVGEKTTEGGFFKPANGTISAILGATIGKIESSWRGRAGTAVSGANHNIILKPGSFLRLTGSPLTPGPTRDLTGVGIVVTDEGAIKDTGLSVTGDKLVLAV